MRHFHITESKLKSDFKWRFEAEEIVDLASTIIARYLRWKVLECMQKSSLMRGKVSWTLTFLYTYWTRRTRSVYNVQFCLITVLSTNFSFSWFELRDVWTHFFVFRINFSFKLIDLHYWIQNMTVCEVL